ncbi:MAG: hypothetical protein WC342_03660 [Methanoregula sp.]|jgi:hypothetical protein
MTDHPPRPAARHDGGLNNEKKILIGAVAAGIIIVVVAAILTFTVEVSDNVTGKSLPHETHYNVALPDGEAVTIGSSRIAVMAYGDSVTTDVDGNREQLVVGQTRIISPRHAVISMLGIPIYQTDFQINLQYLGSSGTKDNFDLTIKTTQSIPTFLLDRLMPASVNATLG